MQSESIDRFLAVLVPLPYLHGFPSTEFYATTMQMVCANKQ